MKKYYKQLHAKKLDKQEQTDKFLETHQVFCNLGCKTKSQ